MLRVDLAALAYSAAQVNGHGEDVASAHLASQNRIEAAQSGWVGQSADALDARMAAWAATSRTLLTRVGDYALALNNDAIGFATMERDNADALRAVGGGAAPTAR